MNVIFGAGGFAREVSWLMEDLAKLNQGHSRADLFVASDEAPNIGQVIHGVEVMGESQFFAKHFNTSLKLFIAVGSPELKQKLRDKCLSKLNAVSFPSLVHPSAIFDSRIGAIHIGAGAIICAGTVLTTDVHLGEFVHLNLNCTIGHDAVLGDFSTLSPGVHISGGVQLGANCFIGTGAVILENARAPSNTVIGAGATVVKSLVESGTYVGTPARLLK